MARQTTRNLLILATLSSILTARLPHAVRGADAVEEKAVDFARDIQPVFAEHCLSCHSGEQPEAGLRLSERAAALAPGDSGRAAIVPGRPEASELIRRVTAADPGLQMPPEDAEPLPAEAIDRLRRWIAEGASWGGHWAFQPLADPLPPSVRNESWIRDELDRFVLAKLEEQGIPPSPEADRFILIKRLHYDLLGLPAPVEAVDAFVRDESPRAYEALVDRLLESPHFGERWGRHWLDLAHYADSDGYEKDRERPDAYVYRDWVIAAINRDLPFDQFTIEQLAGDLLPEATAQQRVGTAFLRQTLTNEEGGVDQEEYRVAAVFDRTETVGTAWLGLTVGCARCHAHKYDPLPHEEYYRLFAFFNNTDEVTHSLPIGADDLAELERRLLPLETALTVRHSQLAPQALAWETEQHDRVLAQPEGPLSERPLELLAVEAAVAPGESLVVAADRVTLVPGDVAAADRARAEKTTAGKEDRAEEEHSLAESRRYAVSASGAAARVTGFKLRVEPDDRLPQQDPGHAPDGNFVLTGFRAFVVGPDGTEQAVDLHRAQADFNQKGFSPEAALGGNPTGRGGWAVGGKTGAAHWIQFRTREPISLGEGQHWKFLLDQQYGGQHTLGRFRLAALVGDERGLHLSDPQIADALEMYPEKRVAALRQRLFDYYVGEVARDEEAKSLHRQIADLQRQFHARLLNVRIVRSPLLPRETRVFDRGDFLAPRQSVQAGVPAVLASFHPRGDRPDRLDLARWLVSAENSLTPRVAVNHVWLHMFGAGLVRTANDFGVRGQPPTHPELLDWLAKRFQTDLHWSRKNLIRRIVTSAAYRQASRCRPECEAGDPLNTLIFRQNRFRVESEIVRDLHLAVGGLLSPSVGGPSAFPPMPEDLAKLSYANNFTWKTSTGDDRYRRGMYTFFKRTIPHPLLMTFDSPDANVACPARTISNTPLQALALLNNETHAEAAQAFARRLLAMESLADDRARLTFAIRCCVARWPQSHELAALERVLQLSRTYYAAHVEQATEIVKTSAPGSVTPPEAAAWVAVTRLILNLDEFLTRE